MSPQKVEFTLPDGNIMSLTGGDELVNAQKFWQSYHNSIAGQGMRSPQETRQTRQTKYPKLAHNLHPGEYSPAANMEYRSSNPSDIRNVEAGNGTLLASGSTTSTSINVPVHDHLPEMFTHPTLSPDEGSQPHRSSPDSTIWIRSHSSNSGGVEREKSLSVSHYDYEPLMDLIEEPTVQPAALSKLPDVTDAHYADIKAKRPRWDALGAFETIRKTPKLAELCRMEVLQNVSLTPSASRAKYTVERLYSYLIQSRGKKNAVGCSKCRQSKNAFGGNDCVSVSSGKGPCAACLWRGDGKNCKPYQDSQAHSDISASDDDSIEEASVPPKNKVRVTSGPVRCFS